MAPKKQAKKAEIKQDNKTAKPANSNKASRGGGGASSTAAKPKAGATTANTTSGIKRTAGTGGKQKRAKDDFVVEDDEEEDEEEDLQNVSSASPSGSDAEDEAGHGKQNQQSSTSKHHQDELGRAGALVSSSRPKLDPNDPDYDSQEDDSDFEPESDLGSDVSGAGAGGQLSEDEPDENDVKKSVVRYKRARRTKPQLDVGGSENNKNPGSSSSADDEEEEDNDAQEQAQLPGRTNASTRTGLAKGTKGKAMKKQNLVQNQKERTAAASTNTTSIKAVTFEDDEANPSPGRQGTDRPGDDFVVDDDDHDEENENESVVEEVLVRRKATDKKDSADLVDSASKPGKNNIISSTTTAPAAKKSSPKAKAKPAVGGTVGALSVAAPEGALLKSSTSAAGGTSAKKTSSRGPATDEKSKNALVEAPVVVVPPSSDAKEDQKNFVQLGQLYKNQYKIKQKEDSRFYYYNKALGKRRVFVRRKVPRKGWSIKLNIDAWWKGQTWNTIKIRTAERKEADNAMGEGADPDDMLSSGSGNKMISNSDLERQLTQNQFLSQNPLTSEKENTNDRNEKINDHNRDSTADRFSSASEGGGPKMIRSLRTCSSKHIVFHDEVAKKYGEAGLEVYADVSTDDSDPGSEPESEEELGIKSAGEGLQPRGKNNSSAKTTSSRKDQQNINPDHANSSDDEDYKKLVENWRSEQQKLVQQLQNNSLTNVLKLKKINPQALLGEIETTIPADVKKQLKAKLRTMKRNAKNKIMFEQAHRRAPVGNTRLNSVLANIEKRLGEKGIAGADYSSNIVRKTKTGGNKRAAHHEKRAGFKYDLDDGFINDDSDEGGNVKETQKTFSDIESDDKNKSSDDGGEGGKKAKKRKKMKNKNNDETTGGTVSGAVGSRLSSGKKKFAEDFDDLADKKNTTKNENDNDDSEQDQNSDMNSSSDTEDVDSEEERAKLREKQRFKELEKARKLDPAKFRICLPEDPWDFLLDEKELEKIGESAEYQKLQKNSVTSMLQNDLKLVVCGVKDRDEWEKLHLSPASTNLALFQKSNLKPLAFIRRWLEQAVLTNGVPNMEDSFLQQIELPFIPDRNKPFCLATYVRRNLNTIIRSKFDSKILWRWEKAVAEDIRTNWWRFDEDVISLPNPAILTEREEELWCDFIYKLGREAARTALNAQKRVFSTTWHQFVKIWLKCGDEELKLACREYSAPVLRLFKEKCLMNEIWLMHLRNFSHMQALGGKLQSIQYQESRREQYKRLAFGALLVRKLWLAFRRAIKMMHAHNYGEMPRKNHTPGWHGDKLFELFVNTLQHHWLSECEEKIVKGQMFALVDLGPTILRREFDSHNAAVALAERNKTSSMAQQQNFATGTGAPPAPNPSSSDDELLNSEKITTATMGELRPPMPLCGKLFVLAKEAEEQYTMQLSMMSQEEELRIQKQLQRAGLQKPMNLAGNEEGRSVDIIVGDGNKDPSLHENNKTTGSGAATGAASALVSKKKLPAKANRVLPAKGKAAPGKAKGVVVSGSSAGGDGAATSAGPGILQQPAGGTTATGTVITGTTVQQGVLKPPPPLGTASAAGSTNTNAANAAAMHMQPPGGAGSTTFPLPNLPFPAAPQTPGHQHPMMMHMQQPGGATGFVNPMMSQMPQPQMILQPASGVQQNMQMQMSAGGHQAFLTQQQQYQQQQQMAQQQHMQLQQQQMMQQQHQMQQQYMQQQQQLNAQNIKKSSPPAPVAPSPAEPPRQPQAAGITRAASSSSAASSAVQQVVVPSSHQQRQLQQPQLQPQSQQPARNRTGGAGASSSTTAANSARAAAANPDCVPIPLPCNLSLEFNPSVVGQLRSVLSLERQDVFIKDRKTGHQEAYSSLDEAVQGVYARMPPSERGDLHLAHVNDWCAGWHFWRLVIPPPPDAKEKKTQLKRLALHIADCRNSKLQYPFCTRGEGGKLVRGLDLDNFRQLEMVHPKSQKPAVLEEKRNKMLRKGQKGRGRMGN